MDGAVVVLSQQPPLAARVFGHALSSQILHVGPQVRKMSSAQAHWSTACTTVRRDAGDHSWGGEQQQVFCGDQERAQFNLLCVAPLCGVWTEKEVVNNL